MTTQDEEYQPTMDQSLHSIALSMIEIHKETKKQRQIARETLRFMRQDSRSLRHIPIRPRAPRTVWEWMRDQIKWPQFA